MTKLDSYLEGRAPPELARLLVGIANTSVEVRRALPFTTKLTRGVNPSGERQTEIDVYANELFASSLLATGIVSEVASEEMAEPRRGRGPIHVAMDPLDGSSNISTNNPLGSIFGFYSSPLPCSGEHLVGAAFVTYGPMLTLTYTAGDGVNTFALADGPDGERFVLLEEGTRMPDEPQVYGLGGERREWIEPVERFVSGLEERGLKLRYGGTFVGDFNQVLRRGGIFGYPALRGKPRGKLRVLYEAAPMALIAKQAGGSSSDGEREVLSLAPKELAETTPLYVGSTVLVREVEGLIRAPRARAPGS
ncbi:MAG: class 1 fructose-bisphosphatase [Nitrososphaerales archaeon]